MNSFKNFAAFSLLAIWGCSTPPNNKIVEHSAKPTIPVNAQVFTTAKDTTLRLTQTSDVAFADFGQPLETQVCVFVDPTNTFQTMVGIGGALTDASAEVFANLPKETQQEFLTAYYDAKKGIGYNFARTNIASCDFSSDTYGYVADNDSLLTSFSVAHDEKFRQAWANHYVKFIKTYEALGIPVWGLSVQNEPMAKQKWESCIFTAEEERDFIKNYLGPTLRKSGFEDKKLIAWDHNRDLIYQRASTLLSDSVAAKYIWGIGFHWYETWTGSGMQFENLKRVKEAFPDKNLIFTEGCVEKFSLDRINDWSLGEKYGYSMVNDFNCGTVAWTDWNILLDENGGPNHVGNFCFAPVHADTKTGKLMYTNSYYYIGHFSKFIQAGAKRISCSTNRDKLQSTAFLNPDGKIVVVVLNLSDEKLPFQLSIGGKAAPVTSLPHSIITVII